MRSSIIGTLLRILQLCSAKKMSSMEYKDAQIALSSGAVVRVGRDAWWPVPRSLAPWLPADKTFYLYFGGGALPQTLLSEIKGDNGRPLFRANEQPDSREMLRFQHGGEIMLTHFADTLLHPTLAMLIPASEKLHAYWSDQNSFEQIAPHAQCNAYPDSLPGVHSTGDRKKLSRDMKNRPQLLLVSAWGILGLLPNTGARDLLAATRIALDRNLLSPTAGPGGACHLVVSTDLRDQVVQQLKVGHGEVGEEAGRAWHSYLTEPTAGARADAPDIADAAADADTTAGPSDAPYTAPTSEPSPPLDSPTAATPGSAPEPSSDPSSAPTPAPTTAPTPPATAPMPAPSPLTEVRTKTRALLGSVDDARDVAKELNVFLRGVPDEDERGVRRILGFEKAVLPTLSKTERADYVARTVRCTVRSLRPQHSSLPPSPLPSPPPAPPLLQRLRLSPAVVQGANGREGIVRQPLAAVASGHTTVARSLADAARCRLAICQRAR